MTDGKTPQTPAGGAGDNARLPAGSTGRSWTIKLPAGLRLLSLNGREHYMERHRRAQALKKAAWAMARNARIPSLERVSLVVEYQPPDRRHRDADNAATASGKPCIDGLVAAGVIEDDESPRYVAEVAYRIGAPHPGGRLVLHVTEAHRVVLVPRPVRADGGC